MSYPLNPETTLITHLLQITEPGRTVAKEHVKTEQEVTSPVVLALDPKSGRKVELIPYDLLKDLKSPSS